MAQPPLSIEDTYAEAREEVPADVRARRIPSSWIDGVARLDHHRPLTDIPPHRWRQFLSDCNNFLTGGENWAGRAAELGWNAASLFGCRRARPLAHPGGAGLLWAIQGGRLVELHRDWAVIELAANGSRRVFERRRVDAGNVTLPWIERGRRPHLIQSGVRLPRRGSELNDLLMHPRWSKVGVDLAKRLQDDPSYLASSTLLEG